MKEITLRFGNYLGYGAGAFAASGITSLVSMLTYFYTDKIGIAASAAGTIIFAAKIIDACTDLGMGYIMDRTNTRWGKARPWFLWMAIPVFVITVLLFMVPENTSGNIKLLYILITNVLLTAVAGTAISIPHGSLMFYVTNNTKERTNMGLAKAVCGYLISLLIAIGLIPFTNALGGNQKAWIIAGCVIGFIFMSGLLWLFFSVKERYVRDDSKEAAEKTGFFFAIKLLGQNKYFFIMLAALCLMNIFAILLVSTGIYYAKWILHNENLMAVMGIVGIIPMVCGFVITQPMVKKFGTVKTIRISLLIGISGAFIRIFFPNNFGAILLFGSIASFGMTPMMILAGVLGASVIEYGEQKTGRPMVGMTNSAWNLGSNISAGFGASLVGWILAAGKYSGLAAVQPQSAMRSIYFMFLWLPLIILIATFILMQFFDLEK